MKKIKVVKLGTTTEDTATKQEGRITHVEIDRDETVSYLFQPCALAPKTGAPAPIYRIPRARLKDQPEDEVEMPVEILGTEVKDKATGFKGTAETLILMETGCIHVEIQPEGKNEEGTKKSAYHFDLLRLEGKAIKKMTTEETKRQKAEKPGGPFDLPDRSAV